MGEFASGAVSMWDALQNRAFCPLAYSGVSDHQLIKMATLEQFNCALNTACKLKGN